MSLPEAKDINKVVSGNKKHTCHSYAQSFRGLAEKENTEGWSLLEQVFNYHFRPENIPEPFGPMIVMDGKRSAIPDDLSNDQLSELEETLSGVESPEYRARINDVLWLRRRDQRYARQAVAAYMDSGRNLEDPEEWTQGMERYERALRLARQIEPRGKLYKDVLAHIESRIYIYQGDDPLYFTSRALEFLIEFRYGDYGSLSEIAKKVAESSRKAGDYRRARTYYEHQAKLHRLSNRQEDEESALVESALCFLDEAEARVTTNEYMAAHSFLAEAINAFRHRSSLRDQVPGLQRRYAEIGEKVLGEMRSVNSGEIDITEYVRKSEEAVTGLNWDDAFYTFVSCVPLANPTELRETAIKQANEFVLTTMTDAGIYDAAGRKIGVRPAATTDDPEQYEAALQGIIEQNLEIHRLLVVQAHIAPMMRKIISEHEITQESLSSLLEDSGLLPDDRKEWFFKAFNAGLEWDFATALHYLIPQIENALRYVLEQNGIAPKSINEQGIEEVWGLERILNHQKTTEVLGESFLFELKSLLVSRLGQNYRNLFAHGLLTPGAMQSPGAVYLWWVIMRLVATPTRGMNAFIERRTAPKGFSSD